MTERFPNCRRNSVLLIVFTAWAVGWTGASLGESQITRAAQLPLSNIYPTPTGIVFPGLNIAAGVNPAALPRDQKTTALELAFSPAPNPGNAQDYFGSIATTDRKWGLGAGYEGSYVNSPTHGAFAGAGFREQYVSLGLDVRDTDLLNDHVHTDLGLLADYGKELELGLVLYGLDGTPQMDVGLGFGRGKNYMIEIDILFPPFSGIFNNGSNFVISAQSTVYLGILGLSFASSYSSGTYEITQSVAALIWVFQGFALSAQYVTPNRATFGTIINL